MLNAPQSPADAVPSWVEHELTENGEPLLSRADVSRARAVLPDEGWLIPYGASSVCLVRVIEPLVPELDGKRLYPSVTRSCATDVQAAQGHLTETQSLSTTFAKRLRTRVVGVVPDNVPDVVLRFDGRSSTRVPVMRNAYEAVLVNPNQVSFEVHAGRHRRRYVESLASVAGASPRPIGLERDAFRSRQPSR